MKNFTKITVLGLVFALALGSANCKKDSEDNTGTMLLLLSLLNQSSCGKLDYSLGYFMAQVAPPSALTGVGGYPWSYESCKPVRSQNATPMGTLTAATGAAGIGPITVVGGSTTTYTYTNGYLSKKEVKGTAKIAINTPGHDSSTGAISATSTSWANCPSNYQGTSVKDVEVVGTTTYTRDTNNNVTTEETKYTCGGNNVTYFGGAYGKKVMTYNADNRILTLKYYVNSDRTYGATDSAVVSQGTYVNTSGANPVATLEYTYTPSSGIPTTVDVVGKSYYLSIDVTTTTAIKRAASTTAVDKVSWKFTTSSPGVLSAATYTEECNSVPSSAVTTTTGFNYAFTSATTGTKCGQSISGTIGTGVGGGVNSYGTSDTASTAAMHTQDVRTRTITLTQDTKNPNRLASYKDVWVYKGYSSGTTSATLSKTTTLTSTYTLNYDSNNRLNRINFVSNRNIVNATSISCSTALSTDAGTCDGTSSDYKGHIQYSYNGNGLGIFSSGYYVLVSTTGTPTTASFGGETFSTATSDEQTAQPTLWNVK